jgi:hypothetical protein
MDAYLLSDFQIESSLDKPEAGMGYQSGTLGNQQGYIVASKVFVRTAIASLGDSEIEQYYTKGLAIQAPKPKEETQGSSLNIGSVVGRYFPSGLTAALRETAISVASNLPENKAYTEEGEEFFRLTAYPDDKRIREDHSLAPGSYATTKTDLTIVPSGLAAVGRFALPTRISARYVFRITPGKGVKIFYGTVIPNYGLCGGGVEVFFPDGTKPDTVDIWRPLPAK